MYSRAGKSLTYKNELLFQHGINYNDLPAWQKRGIGMYYKTYCKKGFNPVSGESTQTFRRGIFTDFELPLGREYAKMIIDIIKGS